MIKSASAVHLTSNTRLQKLKVKYAEAAQEIANGLLYNAPHVAEVDLSLAYQRSRGMLGDYVTLDWNHRANISRVLTRIIKYAADRTRRRPLNIIMQAEPGSGKSHMVKCLAKRLVAQHAEAVTFNMAGMQSIEDLSQPLDAVRSLKVEDRLPVLFLDEFDSDPKYYAMLLPLMWDGELRIGHRDLKLGKLVIILAGSGRAVAKAMEDSRGMRAAVVPDKKAPKLVDLISRITGGVLSIPSLDGVGRSAVRRVDKVCLTIALLQNRFGDSLETVPWAFLRFVVMSKFQHGARSITHLVDMIAPPEDGAKALELAKLNLPLDTEDHLSVSTLANHIYAKGGAGEISGMWNKCAACPLSVRIATKPEKEEPD